MEIMNNAVIANLSEFCNLDNFDLDNIPLEGIFLRTSVMPLAKVLPGMIIVMSQVNSFVDSFSQKGQLQVSSVGNAGKFVHVNLVYANANLVYQPVVLPIVQGAVIGGGGGAAQVAFPKKELFHANPS